MIPTTPANTGTRLLALTAIAVAALALAIAAGSVKLSPAEIFSGLTDPNSGLPRTLIMELRLPRAMSAFAVGGLLAVA
ncbi:MAG: iron chelate uptake ABC transporter family permease subunit, partial [Gammaproteobacteria bacterium]